MSEQTILDKTRDYVKETLYGESTGHDWWHIYRVWQTALYIGKREGADLFVIQLAALLHDIADWKFHDGNEQIGPQKAKEWLQSLDVDPKIADYVAEIIMDMSFKGARVRSPMRTLEGQVVQDADRLDAIGAIGIARAFAYGGYKQEPIYDPDLKPRLHESFEEYKKNKGTTINHFYEKLLLLKNTFNTVTARHLAEDRHKYMEQFLARFLQEWEVRFDD